MLRLKKKVVATTLAAGLVLSSVPALGTINTYSGDSVVYAADQLSDFVERIKRIYNNLAPEDQAKITQVREAIKNLTTDQWEDIIGPTITQNVRDKTGKEASEIAEAIALIFAPNSNSIESDIEYLRTTYAGDFHDIFGDDLTVDRMLEFIAAVEEKLTSESFIIGQLLDASDLDEVVKRAIDEVTKDPQFSNLDGILSRGLGVGIDGLIGVKNNLAAKVDPGNTTLKAIVKAVAMQKGAAIEGPTTLNVNGSSPYKFKIDYQGKPFYLTENVRMVSSNPSVASFSNNILTAHQAGTTKVSAEVLDGVELASLTVTVSGGSVTPPPGGGTPGGGTPGAPVTTTPSSDAVPVTEQTGTNAKGQTTNTITINAEAAVKIALDHKEPVNLVITATKAADVTTAPIPVDLINKLNTDDPNNTITLNTPAGAITISVTELSNALLAAAAQGIDVTKAQVNIVVEKGNSADRNLVQKQVGSASEILSDVIQTRIVIASGDKNIEVKEYKGYVDSSVVLNGTYNASQLVGIDYKGSLGTATKTSLTVAAETSGYAPVPTIITRKDGKTTVVLKKKTSAPFAVVKSNISFSDVTNQWFAKDVTLLANKHLVKGVKENTFAPNQTLTRAEFAAMIVRALGLPEDVNKGISFSDVKATDWHAGYVGAAAKAGIINGVGDGRFNPNGFVTRQEIAKMVVAAIQYAGGNLSAADKAALGKFSDASKVSDWAVDAVAIAATKGILLGADGKLNPQGNSTRAEAATFIKRFMTDVKFISE
jgi:hypothetical protein